jgi:hypothetical protein
MAELEEVLWRELVALATATKESLYGLDGKQLPIQELPLATQLAIGKVTVGLGRDGKGAKVSLHRNVSTRAIKQLIRMTGLTADEVRAALAGPPPADEAELDARVTRLKAAARKRAR